MRGTLSKPMKILASIIAVVVLVVGILAWSTWRKKVTAAEQQQAQAQQLKKHKSEERKKAAEAAANQLTDEEKQQYTDLAIKFEQSARNWGSDPTINLDSLSQHDAQQEQRGVGYRQPVDGRTSRDSQRRPNGHGHRKGRIHTFAGR